MPFLNATPSVRQMDIGLLVMRLVLGTIFIAHGAQKLFEYGVGGFSGNLAGMGVPLAGLAGALVVLAELGGGIGVLLGLLTRAAAAGIAVTMLGAIGLVHWQSGFFAPEGFEFPLMLLATAVTLMVTGAGAWSVDALVDGRRESGAAAGVDRAAERSVRPHAA